MRVELCSSFDDGNVTFSPHDSELAMIMYNLNNSPVT